MIRDFDIRDNDIRVFKIGKYIVIQELSEKPTNKLTVSQDTEVGVFKYVKSYTTINEEEIKTINIPTSKEIMGRM